ncbi:MAG: exosortase K [Thermodesulfobacteriota bacterium]
MQSSSPDIASYSADRDETALDDFMGRYIRTRVLAAGLIVLIMLLLKRHYSLATAAQLDWILAPTATLVAWFTSANPVLESGVGYVDFAKGIVVAPGCAGVNFMIMAFGLAAFCGLHHIRRLPAQLIWLVLALAAAYGLTLVVNTVRIALSIALYEADIYSSWLTAARVHRLAGVALYLGALWLYFLGLRQVIALYCNHLYLRKHHRSGYAAGWLVMGWYLVGAVGVPLANGAWQKGLPAFSEHCATVILGGFAVLVTVTILSRVFKVPYRRMSGRLEVLRCFSIGNSRNVDSRCEDYRKGLAATSKIYNKS